MRPLILPVFPSWGSYARKQLVRKMLEALHPGFSFVLHDWPFVELEVHHEKTGIYVKERVAIASVFSEPKKLVGLLQEEACYHGN